MRPYVDYDYYLDNFKGSLIPVGSFGKKALEASRKINYYTSNRIKLVNDDIKDATCSIAELLYNQEFLKNKIVNNNNENQKASESVGPWSVTYINNSQYQSEQVLSDKELSSSVYRICKEYLSPDLLFRGVR